MKIYNYTDVCDNLTKILDEAREKNEVMIKSKSGELFIVQLASQKEGAAYNLPDLELGLTREEIVAYIKEVRERQ